MTLREFVSSGPYGRARLPGMKASSRDTACRALDRDILPTFGDLDLVGIETGPVGEWYDALSSRAPGGATRCMQVFRSIMRYAVSLGLCESDPTRHCRANPPRKVERYLSTAEVARLHAALDACRSRFGACDQADIIRLLLLTGCRLGEIAHLRWSEVAEGCLRLADSKTGARTVWLGPDAQAVLDSRQRRGRWVFPDRRDESRPRSKELCAWYRIRREAGIEDCRIHDLRHTFASHAVMRGVPLPVVSRLLGHATVRMTMRYAHVADRETAAAAERIGSALTAVLEGPE